MRVDLSRMSEEQCRRVKKLVCRLCANYDGGAVSCWTMGITMAVPN